MSIDPRKVINLEPMSNFQIVAVVICILLNALDGFDVLAVTFAAPGIAESWGLGPETIGAIISSGLVGMAVGSIFLAPIADVYGRRLVILACLLVMGFGMLGSAIAADFGTLILYRFFTGLGIGTMLASINAMVSEYSNDKRRDLCVSLMTVGYPIGGVIGGTAAAILLGKFGWESVFLFGGIVTLAVFPLVLFVLPESIEFLSLSKGNKALGKINKILKRMGHKEASFVAIPETPQVGMKIKDLFSSGMTRHTVILTGSYFLHIMTFYYVMGWVPSIVTELGFDRAVGTSVSVWISIGGIVGGSLFGWAVTFVSLQKLAIALMLTTGLLVILFGQVTPDIDKLKIVAFLLGFCMFSGVVGLYALIVRAFPTRLRATGTGFVIGVGRAGAAIGPLITGFLFSVGFERGSVALVMAVGSISAALVLIIGRLKKNNSKNI